MGEVGTTNTREEPGRCEIDNESAPDYYDV